MAKSINLAFNNVTEFKRYLDKNSDKLSKNGILTKDRYEFFQTKNWEEFEQYIRDGNKEIISEMQKKTRYYIDKFESQSVENSQYLFDVVGEFFDIGAVMAGEPEAWIKEIKVLDDKFITLDIQGVYHDGTNLDMVRDNGAKVLAIAVSLEKQGYLVKINMLYSGVNGGGKGTVYKCKIVAKDYDSFLDYKKFGILLGVPFFRRGILRSYEIEFGSRVAKNFGQTLHSDNEIRLDNSYHIDDLEQKLRSE